MERVSLVECGGWVFGVYLQTTNYFEQTGSINCVILVTVGSDTG